MKLLKVSSGVSVALGLLLAFYSFYIMSLVGEYMNPEMTKTQYNIIKMVNVSGILVIAEGVFFVIAGVYALANIGEIDAAKRIKKWGLIMVVMGVIDLLIMIAGVFSEITLNGLFTIALPLIVAIAYYIGASINQKYALGDSKNLES